MSNFKYIPLILACLCANLVSAWEVNQVEQFNLPNNSASYLEFKAEKEKHFPVYLKATYIDQKKLKAKIVQQANESKKSLIEIVDDNQAIIGINGGYYRENFLPNGLLVIQGEKYSRMVNNDLLQGLVKLDLNDHLSLSARNNDSNIYSAFQAGPILYQNKIWNRPDWHKVRKRSLVLEFANQNIMLINTSAVSLNNLVNILQTLSNQFPESYSPLSFVLNLDGGRSSAFFIMLSSPVVVQEQDYIKTAILFTPRE